MRPRWSSRGRGIFLALLIVLAAALLASMLGERCRIFAKSACILSSIANGHEPLPVRAYVAAFAQPVEVEEVQVPGSSGAIPTLVYSPAGSRAAPMVIVIHGMELKGSADPHIVRLARRMASMGFRVATPQVETERFSLMRKDALANIGDVALWAAAKQGRPVPLIGFSFSGGLVLATAAQPRYAQHIALVFCVSGYNDIRRLGEYYLGNGAAGPHGDRATLPPMASGALLIAIQHMDEMVPAEEVDTMRRMAMEAFDQGASTAKVRRDVAALPPAERELFLDLELVRTADIRRRYEQLMLTHAAELDGISPREQMGGIKAPIYLLHGKTDNVVPLQDAEWNLHDAEGRVPARLFVTPWMRHVDLIVPVAPWSKLAAINYLSTVLAACGLR